MSEPSLDILWVRHGSSCGNSKEFSTRSKLYKLAYLQSKNPCLSNLGLAGVQVAMQAKDADGLTVRSFLNQGVDRVFSSDLLRAIETALLISNHRTVTVLPYVGEQPKLKFLVKAGLDLENKQENEAVTRQRLNDLGYDTKKVNYQFYHELVAKPDDPPAPNLHHLVEKVIMKHWMNSESPHYLFTGNRQHVRVAIVTHGHFLRQNLPKFSHIAQPFWVQEPIFRDPFCTEPYQPTMFALGNVGMILSPKLDGAGLARWLSNPKHYKFRTPLYVFDTSAAFDPTTGECMKYNHRRFILPEHGRKVHVDRCNSAVRGIPTLK